MTIQIDRRALLLTGMFGAGALTVPGFAKTSNLLTARGFTHSVASGEPSATTMLLWTRYVPPAGDAAKVRVEVSPTADFAKVVARAEQITGPWRDHTVKLTVDGLTPGTRYFYRFAAPDGTLSPVGRTKTLPEGPANRATIAVFSCSNLPFGYFNAYAHAAARDDIDLWVHLGDYFYEYGRGGYEPDDGAVDGRWPEPYGEIIHLTDYRLRYASYRADPDLQALHAAKPMLASMDDHESANNSREMSAQNHQPDTEGLWSIRKAAAMQAYREWMPVSDLPWASYDIGTLATLYRTETRLLYRSDEPDFAPLMTAADPAKAMADYRAGPFADPARTMLGTEQEVWLSHAIARSVRAGQRWQVAGFGTIMGERITPPQAVDWLKPYAPAKSRAWVEKGVAAGKAGLPMDTDGWGGFPAARARFLGRAQAAEANLIVLSGDSHNAWAFDLGQGGRPAGVEFAGHSVTSPGYDDGTATDPRVIARALAAANPELKWCDTSRRGYMALTLTPDSARNDWVFVDTILRRNPRASIGHSATVARGRNVMG